MSIEVVFDDSDPVSEAKLQEEETYPENYEEKIDKPEDTSWYENKKLYWVATVFDLKDVPSLWMTYAPDDLQYVSYQLEKCETSGKLHYQCYIEFQSGKPKRYTWLTNNLFTKNHYHKPARNPWKARSYSMKQKTRVQGPFEIGQWSDKKQGRRADIETIREDIASGKSLKSIADENFTWWHRNYRACEKYKQMCDDEFIRPPQIVQLYTGVTGAGKTVAAKNYFKEKNMKYSVVTFQEKTTGWFDEYNGEEALIIDEFGPRQLDRPTLNKVLFNEKCAVPVKGAFTHLKTKEIIITSNSIVEEWYPKETNSEHIKSIYRRISKVVPFTEVYHKDIDDLIEQNMKNAQKAAKAIKRQKAFNQPDIIIKLPLQDEVAKSADQILYN